MRESTIGSRAGSHLHWELILQKDDEEIYLGRNMPNPELYYMLNRILDKCLILNMYNQNQVSIKSIF